MSHNPSAHEMVQQTDIEVNFDDSSPKTLITFPAGTLVSKVYMEVTETWDDGAKALIVGDAGNPDGFVEDLGANLGTVGFYNTDHDTWGAYLWHLAGSHAIEHVYTAATAVIATFTGTGDGGSQGIAVVHFLWRKM